MVWAPRDPQDPSEGFLMSTWSHNNTTTFVFFPVFPVVFQRLHDRDVTNRPPASVPIKLGPVETGTKPWSESVSSQEHRDQPREELPTGASAAPASCSFPSHLLHTCAYPCNVCSPAGGCWDFHGLSQDPMMLSPGPALQHLGAQYVVANFTSAFLTKSLRIPISQPFHLYLPS